MAATSRLHPANHTAPARQSETSRSRAWPAPTRNCAPSTRDVGAAHGRDLHASPVEPHRTGTTTCNLAVAGMARSYPELRPVNT